ncbi:hypothetical protein [Acinetobacter sp.]|uniref:Hint domain-containing protein n=1 Tax=Acinetobacter sp. TaxID=472 RepID=UPI003D06C882
MAPFTEVALTKEELIEAHIIANPDLWAEAHLRSPMDPTKPLNLRKYQKRMLRDRKQRKLLRLGRRTGKSVYLAVEALWKAFTNKNRQVLLTAAYETQIDNLFDLIKRMAFDSPDIKESIAGYRKKPFELWFKNGSVIRGLVANASIRGKCLVKGTQVWMSSGSYKSIEDIEVGDRVFSMNTKTGEPVLGDVTSVYDNGLKEVFELRTTSARRLLATANHPVFAMGRGWVNIENLHTLSVDHRAADFIAVMDALGNLNWSRVANIKSFGYLPTYDIEVEKHHNFLAFYPSTINESGFTVSGLANGGIVVHNSADDLIIDEGDYIPQDVLLADIWPIATTYAHTEVIFSSTPTGRREFFWKISANKNKPEYNFTEYHIPSSESPEWTPEQEALVRAITTRLQYQHEYEAEFGDALEGVFRNGDIDNAMYVYDYKDLKYNPNNYYTLGVDWNEQKNGVQIVVLEYLNDQIAAVPYRQGAYRTSDKIMIRNKFRVFYVDIVDASDYINTTAVDTILKVMMAIKPNWSVFDHGHGHTNWELMRLAIKKGETSTGLKVVGISHLIDKMAVLDFGSTIETIDPIDQSKQKHKAKNFLVRLATAAMEHEIIMMPACNAKGEVLEDAEKGLVAQMREYSIARMGQRGEVYEAGPSGDHRLDAFMLAVYAYGMEHDDFLHYNFDVTPRSVDDHLTPVLSKSRLHTPAAAANKVTHTADGMTISDYGNWAGKGEPPDIFPDEEYQSGGLVPRFQHASRNSGNTRRGSRRI